MAAAAAWRFDNSGVLIGIAEIEKGLVDEMSIDQTSWAAPARS
jgi:hypothetical protein